MRPRLIIAGGSGFLGGVLAKHFTAQGWEVVVLTRSPRVRMDSIREVGWDGETLAEWVRELENARALVNLAGVSVNCRYHARNRKLILDSRVNATRVLGKAIARCANAPEVWLNSSTATIYKHTYGPAWDEAGDIGGTPEAKDEISVEVARAWEQVFYSNQVAPIVGQASRRSLNVDDGDRCDACPTPRRIALRSAMVLGTGRNSVFPVLRRLTRLGLGGSLAGGRQFVSWIHERDFCRAIGWLIERRDLNGTFNLAAPNPVPNAELMGTLCKVCRRPFGLPASRWMLEIGAFFLRTETELVIKSRRVVPGRLLKEGFTFEHPLLRPTLEDLLKRYR